MISTFVLLALLGLGTSTPWADRNGTGPVPVPYPVDNFDENRIVNGESVGNITEFPQQALLLRSTLSIKCGAVIICPSFILTAAHCFPSASGDLIWAGSVIKPSSFDNLPATGQLKSIVFAVNHPDYVNGQASNGVFVPNDLAVAQLDSPFTITAFVQLAVIGQPVDDAVAFLTGWGRLSGGGSLPTNLQKTETVIISDSACTEIWGDSYDGDRQVCFFDQESGSCNGDSGGPAFDTRRHVIGITSWGVQGCLVSFPSVYVLVWNFQSFIQEYAPCAMFTCPQ